MPIARRLRQAVNRWPSRCKSAAARPELLLPIDRPSANRPDDQSILHAACASHSLAGSTPIDGAGRVLAAATNEAEIFVWDATTWGLLHTVQGPQGHVRGLTLSRDGRSLAAIVDDSQEGIAVLHDLETGAHAERRIARSEVGRIDFTAEDQRLLLVHEHGVACLTKNLEPTDGPVPEAAEGILASTVSTDGHLLALGLSDKTVRLFDFEHPHSQARLEGLREAVHAVAVSADRRLIAGGDDKGRVAIWDVETHAVLVNFDAHAGTVHELAFYRNGLELASIGSDGHCRIWRVADGSLLLSLELGQPIGDSVIFSPDGRQLIATAHANSDVGSVCIWNASAHRGSEAFPVVPSRISDVPVSEATRKLVAWHRDRHDSPPSIDRFMRYLQWWAAEQGFGAAVPTYRYAGVDGMLLTEVVLIDGEHVGHDLTQPENANINQGREFPEMNRRADMWAKAHGAAGGLIDFGLTRSPPHPDWHFALLDSAAVERREVPAQELEGMDSSPRHRLRLFSAWAIRHGYLGAFPTWQDREENGQQLLGALCIKPEAGARSWFVIGE